MKQNKGEYRRRYDEVKAAATVKWPDKRPCHIHSHAKLLSVKRLFRDLWVVWNKAVGEGEPVDETEISFAPLSDNS